MISCLNLLGLLYASRTWWGFTAAEEITRLHEETKVWRLIGLQLPESFYTIEAKTADHQQLCKSIILNSHRVLSRYFPKTALIFDLGLTILSSLK